MASKDSDATDSSNENILYSINPDYDPDDISLDERLSLFGLEDLESSGHDRMKTDSEDEGDPFVDEMENDSNQIGADATKESVQWVKEKQLDTKLPVFDGQFGLKEEVKLPTNPTPCDFFNLFLTSEIVDYIVEQSNLYRTQEDLKQEPMDRIDFYRLLGFLFYSSLIRLPSKSDYWSSGCGVDLVMKNVTRDRVDQLLRTLHFNNNILQQQPVDKIQPLIDRFNDRCSCVVHPESIIAIDEQMVKYKGKTAPKSLKQYMPQKPTKRGFKFWSKCGASSFTYKVKLYEGSTKHQTIIQSASNMNRKDRDRRIHTQNFTHDDQEKTNEFNDLKKRVGLSGLVVLDLLDNFPKGTHVFVDNYFSSIGLLREMTLRGYGLTCTLRSNRIGDCPIESEKTMMKKPRGYLDYLASNDKKMIIVAWHDNRRVLLGSNIIGIEPVTSSSRWDGKTKQRVLIETPHIVKLYNQNMGSVDMVDMFCALHPIPFRSKKWYMRIAWRIFELMIVNAWVLWKRFTKDMTSGWRVSRLFSFKMYVAKTLLQHPTTIENRLKSKISRELSSGSSDEGDDETSHETKRKREMKAQVPTIIRFDGIEHWPEVSGVTRLRCKNDDCSNKTNVSCSKCRLHLCLTTTRNCFKDFHVQKQ